jgi:hypothetical protein
VEGIYYGIAPSVRFGRYLEATPYVSVGKLFSMPTISGQNIHDPYNPGRVGETETEKIQDMSSTTLISGLDMTYRPWGLGFSIGSLLTSRYTPSNGLKYTHFSISKSFGNYGR